MLLLGHCGGSQEMALPPVTLPFGQKSSLTAHFPRVQVRGWGRGGLSVQQRPVVPCASGGHTDLGLLWATSLPEELNVLSGVIYYPPGALSCSRASWGAGLGFELGFRGCKASLSLPNRGVLKK